jgi:hypothetical protein
MVRALGGRVKGPHAVGAQCVKEGSSSSDPYSALVSAVNFGSVTTDVVAVAALVAAVLVSIRGVRFMLGIIRR